MENCCLKTATLPVFGPNMSCNICPQTDIVHYQSNLWRPSELSLTTILLCILLPSSPTRSSRMKGTTHHIRLCWNDSKIKFISWSLSLLKLRTWCFAEVWMLVFCGATSLELELLEYRWINIFSFWLFLSRLQFLYGFVWVGAWNCIYVFEWLRCRCVMWWTTIIWIWVPVCGLSELWRACGSLWISPISHSKTVIHLLHPHLPIAWQELSVIDG